MQSFDWERKYEERIPVINQKRQKTKQLLQNI